MSSSSHYRARSPFSRGGGGGSRFRNRSRSPRRDSYNGHHSGGGGRYSNDAGYGGYGRDRSDRRSFNLTHSLMIYYFPCSYILNISYLVSVQTKWVNYTYVLLCVSLRPFCFIILHFVSPCIVFFRGFSDLDRYVPSKQNWNRLPSFRKNFYVEHEDSRNRSDVRLPSIWTYMYIHVIM